MPVLFCFQRNDDVRFLRLIVKQEQENQDKNRYGNIAVSYIEFREINRNEINKVYHIPVHYAVDQISCRTADQESPQIRIGWNLGLSGRVINLKMTNAIMTSVTRINGICSPRKDPNAAPVFSR